MSREELQALQTPLKNRYRDDPEAAVVTMTAEGDVDATAVSCSVQTGRALVEAGLHPASGGDGTLACSGDMLLQALVACAGVTLKAVATNRDIPLDRRARGGRGGSGLPRDPGGRSRAPVGFREIRLSFDLPSVPDEELATLLKLTERYCVVYQTLARGVPVTVTANGS